MRWKGLLILAIAWVVFLILYNLAMNAPNALDYFLVASFFLLLMICVTIGYFVLLIWKYYQKKKKERF